MDSSKQLPKNTIMLQAPTHLGGIPPRASSMLKANKSSARFVSQHTTPIDKYTIAAPVKQPDIRIRESKNNQMFEKYMNRNSHRMVVNTQNISSQSPSDADSKFGLPSLRSPEGAMKRKNSVQKMLGIIAPPGKLGKQAAASNFASHNRKDPSRAPLDDSDFDF